MSKDNVLKKQFQERDVQRLRNLVQGKFGEKPAPVSVFQKLMNFMMREIFGKVMVVLGLLKMVLNKILPN